MALFTLVRMFNLMVNNSTFTSSQNRRNEKKNPKQPTHQHPNLGTTSARIKKKLAYRPKRQKKRIKIPLDISSSVHACNDSLVEHHRMKKYLFIHINCNFSCAFWSLYSIIPLYCEIYPNNIFSLLSLCDDSEHFYWIFI